MNKNDCVKVSEEVRRLLPCGRGNVLEDILRTNGNSTIRAKAAKLIKGDRSVKSDFKNSELAYHVIAPCVSALCLEAGNCEEHAAVAYYVACEMLDVNTNLLIVTAEIDHAFLLAGNGSELANYYVIDPWCLEENGKEFRSSEWYSNDPNIGIKGVATGDEMEQVSEELLERFDIIKEKYINQVKSQCDPLNEYFTKLNLCIEPNKFKRQKFILKDCFGFSLYSYPNE